MLKELFQDQRQLVNSFFDLVDLEKAQAVLDQCLACQGKLVFTGIGKSGTVAEKLASTLTSTGTRAAHLPAVGALHGDIGMLEPQDLLIVLSKSGESDELIELVPLAKSRGVATMAWISKDASRLAGLCDQAMLLPLKKELCPFDLAPTTSSALQLLFGDILTVALMRAKNFSLQEYALNHPSGAIGKKATLKVADLMLTGERLPICKPTDTLQDILIELSQKRCGCVLVQDEKLLGIFTDGDLRRALQSHKDALTLPISEFMQTEFTSTTPDTLAFAALKLMEGEKRIMMLPVLSGDQLVGLIHLHDILQAGL